MRIAQVAPLFESVPPKYYGGTERVVSFLTEELVRQGHAVTLFASGDSDTRARLVSGCRRALRLDKNSVDHMALQVLLTEKVYSRAAEFAVLHFHIDYLHYPVSRCHDATHLTTLHGRRPKRTRTTPMSYHNGSVWPHDNAIIAAGFGRYALRQHATRVLEGLLDASNYFELQRLPELFCGFARRPGECATWTAAAPLACLEACLGIGVDGAAGRVSFRNPVLPRALERIRIRNLAVANGDVDIVITRHEQDVGVTLTRRNGDIEVTALL
jgi:hypothetical protein